MNNYIIPYNEYFILFISDINIIAKIESNNEKDIHEIIKKIQDNLNGSFVKKIKISESKIINNKYYGNSLCIIPSNICRLACKYCYSDSGTTNQLSYINFNNIKKVIDILFENTKIYKHTNNNIINILFHGGGEPTNDWDLFKRIVDYIIYNKNKYNCKLNMRIVTNGIINEIQANWLGDNFSEVIISIDGPPYINNITRPFPNNNESSSISMKTAKIISKKTKLGIHAVVTALSKSKGADITDYFLKEISNLSFINYEKYKPSLNGRNDVLKINNQDFIDFIFECIRVGGSVVKSSIINVQPKNNFCKACNGRMLYCFPNNKISVCNEHDNDLNRHFYVIGDFNDKISLDSCKLDYVKNDVLSLQNEMNCKDCFAFSFCRGGCRSFYTQSSNYSKEWCELYKNALLRFFNMKIESNDAQQIKFIRKFIKYISL